MTNKGDLKFGPGGFGMPTDEAIPKLNKDGLSAAEIEFTYGVNISNDTAKRIGDLAKKFNVKLSIHAPYYINLNSEDKQKIFMSKKRILDSCERANYLGAEYVVFHPAFYLKKDKEEVYQIVKKEIIEMMEYINKKNWKVKLAPETTGKESQFGSIDELIRLHKETGCFFCIDFAHLKARNNGKVDYDKVFEKLKKTGINKLHCHFSGIEYTSKGEKRHIKTSKENWNEILPLFKKFGISGTIINESPDNWSDSLQGLRIWDSLNK